MRASERTSKGTSEQVRSRDSPLSQGANNRRLISSAVENQGVANDNLYSEDEVVTYSDLPKMYTLFSRDALTRQLPYQSKMKWE